MPTSPPKWRSNYTLEEVEALIEGYEELQGVKHKAYVLVRLMDIDRALPLLTLKQRQAVFLVGMLGMDTRSAGDVLGISHEAVLKRYRHGLVRLTEILNRGGR